MRGKLFMAPWSVAMENACARGLIACDITRYMFYALGLIDPQRLPYFSIAIHYPRKFSRALAHSW